MSEWISVDDELPESYIPVWVYRPLAELTNDPLMKISHAINGTNISPQGVEHKFDCWCHVTHWQPLPEPPK